MAVNLGILLTAQNMASGGIKEVQRDMNNLINTIYALRRGGAQLTIGVAMMKTGLFGAKESVKMLAAEMDFVRESAMFESSIVKMQNATGFLGSEMDKIRTKAMSLATDTQFKPDESIAGMQSLATAGLNLRQTLEAAKPALTLSSISQGALNADKAAEVITAGMHAFGLQASQSTMLVDTMVKAMGAGTLEFKDLNGVFARGGSVAKSTNQSLQTFLATINTFKDQGGTAADATNKFRMIMMKFQGNLKPAQKGLAAIGLSITDLMKDGQFVKFPDMIDRITVALNKKKQSIVDPNERAKFANMTLTQMLGVHAMQAFNKTTQAKLELDREMIKNISKYNPDLLKRISYEKQLDGTMAAIVKGTDVIRAREIDLMVVKGQSDAANKRYLNTLEGLEKRMQATGTAIKISLGDQFKELVRGIYKTVVPAMEKIAKEFQRNPGLAKAVAYGITGIAIALFALSSAITAIGFGMALNSVLALAGLGGLANVLNIVRAAGMMAFAPIIGFFTNPALLVALPLIGAAILTLTALWTSNFMHIQEITKGVFEGIQIAWGVLTNTMNESQLEKHLKAIGFTSNDIGMVKTAIHDLSEALRELARFSQDAAISLGLISPPNEQLDRAMAMSKQMRDIREKMSREKSPWAEVATDSTLAIAKMIGDVDKVNQRQIEFRRNVETTRDALIKTVEAISEFIRWPDKMTQGASEISSLFESIALDIQSSNMASQNKMRADMRRHGDAIKGFFGEIGDSINQTNQQAQQRISGDISNFVNTSKGFLMDWQSGWTIMWDNIYSGSVYFVARLQGQFNMIPIHLQSAAATAKANFDGTIASIGDVAQNVVSKIIGFFQLLPFRLAEIGAQAKASFDNAIASIRMPSFQLPNFFGGGAPSKVPTPRPAPGPQRFATGGIVPKGYPKDSYPAYLSSGEQVLTGGQRDIIAKALASNRDPFKPGLIQKVDSPAPQPESINYDKLAAALAPMLASVASASRGRPQEIVLKVDGRTLASVMAGVEDDNERRSGII